jgi:hypothetical protein
MRELREPEVPHETAFPRPGHSTRPGARRLPAAARAADAGGLFGVSVEPAAGPPL